MPGPVAATYETVTADGCGLLPARDDGKLLVHGPAAAGLLDGQLSNDIAALERGAGCAATLLTGKGRMLAFVRVLHRSDGYLLLTDRPCLQALFDRLRTGALGWAATIDKRTLELARIELLGPGSDAVAATVGVQVPGMALHACSDDCVRTADGLEVLVPADDERSIRARLADAGALTADESLAELLRVESGRPRWGHELDDQTMPEEVALTDSAVSFTKGCYVGQETVARLHWKGRPNRHLRRLDLTAATEGGAPVTGADDGRLLGAVGTAVRSPTGRWLGLAVLRREAEPGQTVLVDGSPATVSTPGANTTGA